MASATTAADTAAPSGRVGDVDLRSILPLELIRSQLVPPAPNRRRSAFDWLPDFGGFSWIAYGASSLLVVSHCPSPLTLEEPHVGPFLKQVIEPPPSSLYGDGEHEITSVSWRPSRPPDGKLAASAGRFIRIFSTADPDGSGSLSWRQVACLTHSFGVKSIVWTGSGDGIVSVGYEVVLWKQDKTWEVTCKLNVGIPQDLVSSTWSIFGPVAMVSSSTQHDVRRDAVISPSSPERRVLVCQNDSKFGFFTTDLWHPDSVCVIQWRPSGSMWSNRNSPNTKREVLLTCCVDGVVRLWSEVDGGRGRKHSKDPADQKNIKRSYHVIAVIEISYCPESSIGAGMFVSWGADIHAAVSVGGDDNCFATENSSCNLVGYCDWIITVGPGSSLSFWAIHLLDDVSPLRFPRVNSWKKHVLDDLKMSGLCGLGSSDSDNQSILINAVVSRDHVYAPPNKCSLLVLSADHSLCWVHLRNPEIRNAECGSLNYPSNDESLSCSQVAVQNQDGHEGSILQIAVHPLYSKAQVAVSLDSHGILLFWSITTIMPASAGLEAVHIPSWQLCGRFDLQNLQSASEYLNLAWIPFVINGDIFLLVGHAEGIDCFLVAGTDIEGENVVCHRMFTISFSGMDIGNGPYQLYVMPNAFNCMQQLFFNKFMLTGIWMEEFQVLSWDLVMHLEDTSGCTSCCDSETTQNFLFGTNSFAYSHAGKTYRVTADLFNSNYPSTSEQVTSFAIPPGNSILSLQLSASSEDLCRESPMYHMATGFYDGTLKLWRMKTTYLPVENSSLKCLSWEIVGMLNAHQNAVDFISLTNSGTHIATACVTDKGSISELNIWRLLPLVGCGCLSLEHRAPLDGQVVAMSWLGLGDGQALLGVCMQNVLQVYSQTRLIDTRVDMKCPPLWSCVAQCHTNSIINSFLWDPKLTPVLVHENYFSLFSQWSFPKGMVPKEEFFMKHVECYPCISDTEQCEDSIPSISSNSGNYISSNLRNYNISESLKFPQPCYYARGASLYNILTIFDLLVGSLPVYHPKALIFYLSSGKIKRAHMALQHFIDVLPWNKRSFPTTEEPKHSFTGEISLSRYFEAPADADPGQLTWNLNSLSNVSNQHYHGCVDNVWDGSRTSFSGDLPSSTSKQSMLIDIKETLLSVKHIALINDIERNQMLATVDLLADLENQQCLSTYRSFDEPARRFWVEARFNYFFFNRKFGRLAARNELSADSCMIAWAYQSDSQDNLFNSVMFPEPTWTEMRNMGVGYWLNNPTQLRSRMEKLARSQYLLKRDPKDCALLYVALNRLQVLAGLFKLSKDEKDKPLVGFLSRNFQDEKNKAAALKNAYVLLGRHQLELAIAFFLLGRDPSSAILVCARNLGDEQLALVICCLVEGCGGPLEHELITNVLLPNVVSKGDLWLASLLEWRLGNYSQSFKILAESCSVLDVATSGAYNNDAAISDPNIGQYCALLASKNKMQTSIGDHMAALLSQWAILATANALNICGFPLEALECMSSWFKHNEAAYQKIQSHPPDVKNLGILHGITNPYFPEGVNWLSGVITSDLGCSFMLNTAMKYISKLLLEFRGWQHDNLESPVVLHKDLLAFEDEEVMKNLNTKISAAISFLHQRFSLRPLDIINKILISSCNRGMLFPGCNLLHACVSHEVADDGKNKMDYILSHLVLPQMLGKTVKEMCIFLNRCILYCTFSGSVCGSFTNGNIHSRFYPWTILLSSFIFSVRNLKIFMKLYGFAMPQGDFLLRTFAVLDYVELALSFASAWCAKSLVGITLMIGPILSDLNKKESFHEAIKGNITDFLRRILALVNQNYLDINFFSNDGKSIQHDESGAVVLQFLNEKWQFIGATLWRFFHGFYLQQLGPLSAGKHNFIGASKSFEMMPMHFSHSLTMSLACTSSLLRKHLISLLCWKINQGFHIRNILLLKESSPMAHSGPQYSVNPSIDYPNLTTDTHPLFMLRWLLEVSLQDGFYGELLKEKEKWFLSSRQKSSWCWSDVQRDFVCETGKNVNFHLEDNVTFSKCNGGVSDSLLEIWKLDKESIIGAEDNDCGTNLSKEVTDFLYPKEVYRRSGELIEALCSNYINEHEAVTSGNRKGLVFFNWGDERCEEEAEYTWSFCDWPHNGWAEADCTSISSGSDLNNGKDAPPGLNGAVNPGPLARPGRDLTGGGAFGIPGYAGIGASGFGWSLQDGLEELVNPPATVNNISARALSSHPSRPLFLVGSNSCVHLWEFGKEKASAAYGTIPTTSQPNTAALISSLQFDLCGHRFASAAMDGKLCTWQLEVGGRSNVKPTESSFCFKDHACGVSYVGSSGSIIAAAGYNKNDANIIIWDTLAPPVKSQVSIFCHEGGASSLSVFNSGIGCSSVSPIVVTGGRNGDVGLHDFRYVATGHMQRHRHSPEEFPRTSSASGLSSGISKSCENLHGMLWHIEKAHLGSVTRISTIPNTSFFLTGSKDGDVKLWDAKRAKLVFHWPKLHEKHTFFQSGSPGIGGIIRAAVTDIQIVSNGFLTCGGDGTVKFIQLKNIHDIQKSPLFP